MLCFVLREEGIEQVGGRRLSASFSDEPQLAKVVETLKIMSSTMLEEYGTEMRQLCDTLDLTDEHFYSTYCSVAENTLGSDVSLGRVISLMTFTGLLAAHLVKRSQECKVESLLGWERTFINNKCLKWINDHHGGWVSRPDVAMRRQNYGLLLETGLCWNWNVISSRRVANSLICVNFYTF